MNSFLTSVTSLVFLYFAVKQYVSNRRSVHPPTGGTKVIPYIAVAMTFNIVARSFNGDASMSSLLLAVISGETSVFLMTVSFLSRIRAVKWFVISAIVLQSCSAVWNLTCWICNRQDFSEIAYLSLIVMLSVTVVIIYIYGLYLRLRDIKFVMRSGSVWTNVTMSVDSAYMIVYLCITILYFFTVSLLGPEDEICLSLYVLIYTTMYAALAVRILKSSVFVCMTEHERRIVESMKISNVDIIPEPEADVDGTALMYKNLYDRILEYFAEVKPYLDPNLTINDVVSVVFSNKLYISKAINRFTGRNFCQFVNYYRVVHAVELFRDNNELKVQELASQSGFNSPVSFGMAFKLYMGEKPGDWCRREKMRMDKLKK